MSLLSPLSAEIVYDDVEKVSEWHKRQEEKEKKVKEEREKAKEKLAEEQECIISIRPNGWYGKIPQTSVRNVCSGSPAASQENWNHE